MHKILKELIALRNCVASFPLGLIVGCNFPVPPMQPMTWFLWAIGLCSLTDELTFESKDRRGPSWGALHKSHSPIITQSFYGFRTNG